MIIIQANENPILINESITKEKMIEFIDKNIIKIKSLLDDTYRKWYAIKDVKCTKSEKDLFEDIKSKSKDLCNKIVESIESNNICLVKPVFNRLLDKDGFGGHNVKQ